LILDPPLDISVPFSAARETARQSEQ